MSLRALGFLLMAPACVHPGLPGHSHRGPVPAADAGLEESAQRIAATVEVLAGDIGPRSAHEQPAALARAAGYIEATWREQGFVVERQPVVSYGGHRTDNLIVRFPGSGPPLVVGAHYDTVPETPGADDNASGVAALLELTRAFRPSGSPPRGRAIEFVAWTTEEPPFFRSPSQGSAVHAASLDALYGAVSIESVGVYDDARGSQRSPFPLGLVVPSRARFVSFVSNNRSRAFVRQVGRLFRESEPFPTFGGTAPASIPGIDWSDHRSYWSLGPSVMVTDTATFRAPHYHRPSDTPETVDPLAIARVTRGLQAVVLALQQTAAAPPPVAPTLTTVRPDHLDMTRGGLVTLEGSGLDDLIEVFVGDERVPVVRREGGHLAVVRIDDGIAGVYDLEVRSPGGSARLERGLSLDAGVPTSQPCEAVVGFETGDATLSTDAALTLERLRHCLPVGEGTVEVVGYADPRGSAAYNEALGLERARAVAVFLERFQVPRLQVVTRGEACDDEPMEACRRVEVGVVRPDRSRSILPP
ncbi:MAG: M20/M25/M40 family metallo-hydrolase [Myxococcota bacterium]